MKKILTQAEKKWISEMEALLKKQPKNLRMYTCDSTIEVCKLRIPTNEFSKNIGGHIDSGVYVNDMHDNMPHFKEGT